MGLVFCLGAVPSALYPGVASESSVVSPEESVSPALFCYFLTGRMGVNRVYSISRLHRPSHSAQL